MITASVDKNLSDADVDQRLQKKQKASLQVMQDLTHFATPAKGNKVAP